MNWYLIPTKNVNPTKEVCDTLKTLFDYLSLSSYMIQQTAYTL